MRTDALWLFSLAALALPARAVTVVYEQSFYSAALQQPIKYDIILPDAYTNDAYCPVLYILPGRDKRYYSWRGNLDLVTAMTGKTFIAVVADTRNTWYMHKWALYACRDLPAHIETTWRASNVRGITGMSMGGYGAFYLAGYSRVLGGVRYHSLSAMSGAFVEPWVAATLDGVKVLTRAKLADALAGKPFDILFDCGNEDRFDYWIDDYSLAYRNDLMRDELRARGRVLWYNLFYYRPPGRHDYTYWNSRLPVHLDFHQQALARWPYIMITSHLADVTTIVTTPVVRVAGLAGAHAGISNITWLVRAPASVTRGLADGFSSWSADLTLQPGRNDCTFTVRSLNGATNWASTAFFRRNAAFRLRRIKVSQKQLSIRASDVTLGNVDALTNGPGGIGLISLDGFTKTLSNRWTRTGPFMARYVERSPEWSVAFTINGDARKDIATFTCKPRGGNPLSNFFALIRVTNQIPLQILIGSYGAQTNLMLNAKGVYIDKGPWF